MLTRKSVETAVAKLFRPDEVAGILKLLDGYDGKERERVQLCILMLSGNSVGKIKHKLTQANMDYRDVLYWADPNGDMFK